MKYYVYTKTKLEDKIKQLKTYYSNINVNADITNSFKDLENNSTLYIDNLTLLGDSVYKILNTLLEIYSKNIMLIVNERKINMLNFEDIKILVDFEKSKINKRLKKSKENLSKQESKRKKIGRSNKSIFDKHKRMIFTRLNKKETKLSILNKIKEKNPNLKNLTPQALGQYIKKTKEKTLKTIEIRQKEYAMKSIFD
ncbi:hypothetical protein [Aliarcobacter cryaerophilus]|uniref:hypothetical protein n=1 Tax=Aliarcobacter cryaerophilus TaxID=28198 RepID=UPI0011DF34FA|nr:hypothetical protein [Aliarcobacter cryaerophilus]